MLVVYYVFGAGFAILMCLVHVGCTFGMALAHRPVICTGTLQCKHTQDIEEVGALVYGHGVGTPESLSLEEMACLTYSERSAPSAAVSTMWPRAVT